MLLCSMFMLFTNVWYIYICDTIVVIVAVWLYVQPLVNRMLGDLPQCLGKNIAVWNATIITQIYLYECGKYAFRCVRAVLNDNVWQIVPRRNWKQIQHGIYKCIHSRQQFNIFICTYLFGLVVEWGVHPLANLLLMITFAPSVGTLSVLILYSPNTFLQGYVVYMCTPYQSRFKITSFPARIIIRCPVISGTKLLIQFQIPTVARTAFGSSQIIFIYTYDWYS